MQYRIGDKVKFLNDVGGGTVTKLVGKNMVHVENEDGFEIPTLTNEIVLVGEQQGSLDNVKKTEPKQPTTTDFVRQGMQEISVREEVKKKTIQITGNDEPNFQLAFVPENSHNPLEGVTKMYIVNDSNQTLVYNYMHYDGFQYEAQQTGEVNPNTKQIINNLSSADIAKLPTFVFQLLFYKDEASILHQPILKTIDVNSVRFYKAGSFKKNVYFSTPAMLFKLNENEFDKAVEELKVVVNKVDVEPARINPTPKKEEWLELTEVDLHLHELVDSETGMTPKDMLDLQMKTFNEKMEGAIKSNKVKKIVFIHGIGEGRLKNEVRRELNRKYKKYDYQDASFQEYGYGATMVILKRK
ncbi:MAG: DUF2027 domain-containing protein [Mangrovibacterium sp.]